MFNKDDISLACTPLVRLLRIIFVRRGVTHDDFVQKHIDYFNRVGLPSTQLNYDKNNLRRTLDDPEKLSYKMFMHVIMNILHADVVEYSVVLKDPVTGVEEKYSSNDKI